MKISKREKWMVSAAAFTVVIYLVSTSLLLPWWDSLGESRAQLGNESKRVRKYRQMLLGEDSVRAAVSAAEREVTENEKGLLTSKTDALASAEIQGLVKKLALANQLEFRRADLLAARKLSDKYAKVSTRIEVSGDIDKLTMFLSNLSDGATILFVEEARISPTQARNQKSKPVMATLLVSGLKFAEPESSQGKDGIVVRSNS